MNKYFFLKRRRRNGNFNKNALYVKFRRSSHNLHCGPGFPMALPLSCRFPLVALKIFFTKYHPSAPFSFLFSQVARTRCKLTCGSTSEARTINFIAGGESTIHLDIIGPLRDSPGYKFCFTIMDRFTR